MNAPGEIILFQTEDGQTHIDIRLVGETVCLSAGQISAEAAKAHAENQYELYRRTLDAQPSPEEVHFEVAVNKAKQLTKTKKKHPQISQMDADSKPNGSNLRKSAQSSDAISWGPIMNAPCEITVFRIKRGWIAEQLEAQEEAVQTVALDACRATAQENARIEGELVTVRQKMDGYLKELGL
jgi:hypothetical protein